MSGSVNDVTVHIESTGDAPAWQARWYADGSQVTVPSWPMEMMSSVLRLASQAIVDRLTTWSMMFLSERLFEAVGWAGGRVSASRSFCTSSRDLSQALPQPCSPHYGA